MWPWNHLLLGYALYTGYVHLRHRRAPTGPAVLVLVFGTQLPDLIDKPLAWVVGVLPSGVSLAHSLLFALPVSLVALLLGRRAGRAELGTALSIGYLSHLLGDVLYPLVVKGELGFGFLAWPIVPRGRQEAPELLPQIGHLWSSYLEFLSTPRGSMYLLAQVSLLVVVLGAWIVDGRPGIAEVRRVLSPPASPDERDVN